MFIANTLIGFLIAQIWDILRREKNSGSSPVQFNLWFFLKDTWQKILVSLALSILLSLAVHLNFEDAAALVGKDSMVMNKLVYLVIGAVPELVLSYLKRKVGFLQPSQVENYKRKQS